MLIAHSEKRFQSTLLRKLEFCIHHPTINYVTLPSFFSVFSPLEINILVKNSFQKSFSLGIDPDRLRGGGGGGGGEWMQNGMVRNGPHRAGTNKSWRGGGLEIRRGLG